MGSSLCHSLNFVPCSYIYSYTRAKTNSRPCSSRAQACFHYCSKTSKQTKKPTHPLSLIYMLDNTNFEIHCIVQTTTLTFTYPGIPERDIRVTAFQGVRVQVSRCTDQGGQKRHTLSSSSHKAELLLLRRIFRKPLHT